MIYKGFYANSPKNHRRHHHPQRVVAVGNPWQRRRWGCGTAAVMTETLADLLCSDAWWQRVGPDLSSEGRALVKETLTTAAAKLDDKGKDKFIEALRALRAPSEQQRVWLRDVATMRTLPESEKILDFSHIQKRTQV